MKSTRNTLTQIGRPGIGGEYLTIERGRVTGYVGFGRYRQMNHQTAKPRSLGVSDLPASTMIYDLVGAIEAVMKNYRVDVDLDDKGMSGSHPSLRDRLFDLSRS